MLEQSSVDCLGGRAGSNALAHLGWVQVVIDKSIDDLREVALHQRLAESLQTGINHTKSRAELKWQTLGES